MSRFNDESDKAGRASQGSAVFDPKGVVGRKLKSFYDVIETEPVPSHLLDLLEQLDEAERKSKLGK
ncbi:NepR family anti-sigma factor [Sinorhizobium sp. BG8]|uniref:NepR family anti-sigma factor n=1 Tax=Sinorhizobium sp. BG8 TaxID=2613773 RepID=UPI00193E6F8D|nr:NepR family anti-sigma factor [Sinorhizobium sp. BG8]QRM54314.1 hypothetical protein F3Y30_06920 [Sinorhizobium sp. BG8]